MVINKSKDILSNLRRFSNLTPELKATLIKTLLIPVIEYPPVPLCSISKTQKLKIQRIINQGLKFTNRNEAETITTEEQHKKYNITPFNISIHKKACKIWETVRFSEGNYYNELVRPRDKIHKWFPKTTAIIEAQIPEPVYTRG